MSDIIKYECTEQGVRIVPVYREESAQYFVDPAKIPLWEVEVGGQKIQTGAMKIGALYDLLSISQSVALLETGVFDITDTIDSDLALEAIWVEARTPDGSSHVTHYVLVGVGTVGMSTVHFNATRDYRQMELNFSTTSLVSFDGNSRLDLHVAGTVNLELAQCEIVASGVAATPDQGVEYEVIGYTLRGFRQNHNRRVRSEDNDVSNMNPNRGSIELVALSHPYSIGDVTNTPPIEYEHMKEGEQEEAVFVPQISAFSGVHYADPKQYFGKGKVITSHEVEGAASNLKIVVGDEPAQPGNANHRYDISGFNTETNPSEYEGSAALVLSILFQNGPIPQVGNNGVTIEALLALCAHRLEGFQAGPFASQDNEDALAGVLAAMEALQRRTRNRIARQVEGTYQA